MLTYSISNKDSLVITSDNVLDLAAGEKIAFDLKSGGHWFGHGFNHVQPYPLETGSIVNPAFAVNNIQAPIWMCSNGAAILAETKRMLDVRLNENGDGKLRIVCADGPLRLRIWQRGSLPEAQLALLTHLGWPNQPPAAALLGDTLFCTWTQYPRCITQERIVAMAEQIHGRGYPCSTLLIDDRWETCFGELEFAADFPDPAAMVAKIHALGMKVWLWITPFVNVESKGFDELSRQAILVPSRKNKGTAALFKWWGGTAGLIDVTAPQGREWLRNKLTHLQRTYGVDGFKIDGGDYKYQPAAEESTWHEFAGESGYSDALLSLFEELTPNACETRTAWLSQSRSIIWRQGGKDSHWGLDNGLAAMVTIGLHLALCGYDILIPDMVPGRVQTMKADDPLPSDELLVRWTEASAFMPLMQFSYFPWNYAKETEQAVRAYALLHKKLEPYLATHATNRKAPLIRPIWYDAPHVEELFTIADEYMLGPDILVAPVLNSGSVSRDVLLPPGSWIDAWTGTVLAAGWHRGYPAPCPGMPIFVRSEQKELVSTLRNELSGIARGTVRPSFTTATYSAGLNRDLKVTG
jgi:alpha-glucosidase (family GH31 glycosyl hydrolase)